MFATDEPFQQAAGQAGPESPAAPADEWAGAACRDGTASMTELFFSDQIPDILAAKRLCSSCPLSETCLAGALERREPWGVWGGELFLNGRVLAQKRKRGRPPKHAASADQQMTA